MTDYETTDTGHRVEFQSGMRRDASLNKPRYDLCVPLDCEHPMLLRWAELMARGAKKYGERNHEQANSQEELDRFRESAFRHFMAWFMGLEDGEDHAAAVYFNVQGAEYTKDRIKGDK